jgi:two-component system sensor histidine kinase/response regulator
LRLQLIKYLPHELNTPLNSIIGSGQILKDYPNALSQAEIADFGANIYDSGMRLYRLIQNYLLYSELVIRQNTVTTSAPLENPGDLCQSILMNVALKHSRPNDSEILVEPCDALIGFREFSKVAEELIDNAFKFSMPGTKVRVFCGTCENRFCLKISDSGQGMSAEELHQIGASVQFNRTLYEQQGSGMGLSIAKMIVEMYGGEILIESELQKGSTFTVLLNAP